MILNEKNWKKGKWWDNTMTLVDGCAHVSAGCQNCWAQAMIARFCPDSQLLLPDGKWSGRIHLTVRQMWNVHNIKLPDSCRKPRVWAVWNDLFHEKIYDSQITTSFVRFAAYAQHRFIVCTKRPERAKSLTHQGYVVAASNVILMTTAENNETLASRSSAMRELRGVPTRALSVEPLLEPLNDFASAIKDWCDWVVVGCESGPGRRKIDLAAIADVVDTCLAAGIPVFVKQVELDGRIVRDYDALPALFRYRQLPKVFY